jgi:hypothetical protein
MSHRLSASSTVDPDASYRVDAATLASLYDRCHASVDDDGCAGVASIRFASWLAAWWRPDGPPEPPVMPDAISADRRGVQLARWYTLPTGLRGYVPGARGCYVVPAGVEFSLE